MTDSRNKCPVSASAAISTAYEMEPKEARARPKPPKYHELKAPEIACQIGLRRVPGRAHPRPPNHGAADPGETLEMGASKIVLKPSKPCIEAGVELLQGNLTPVARGSAQDWTAGISAKPRDATSRRLQQATHRSCLDVLRTPYPCAKAADQHG